MNKLMFKLKSIFKEICPDCGSNDIYYTTLYEYPKILNIYHVIIVKDIRK